MNSDHVESLDENETKLTLPLKAPPATGDIKKEAIIVEAPSVSSQFKLEPDTVEMENKPIIDKENLLSLNKLNVSGTRIAHKEKQNEEVPSCDDKNDNALEQLKSLLIAQSAQSQKQTDVLLI